jgi:hypothetical protein
MEGAECRSMDDQPDVGFALPADTIDVVLQIAEDENDAIGVCKMINDALSRGRPRRDRLT